MRLTKNNPFCHGCSSGMIRKKKKKQRRWVYRVAIRHDTTARSLRCCVCRTWCNSGRWSSSAELMRSRTGVATPCHYRWMLRLELRCRQKCELKQLNLRVSLKKKKRFRLWQHVIKMSNYDVWVLKMKGALHWHSPTGGSGAVWRIWQPTTCDTLWDAAIGFNCERAPARAVATPSGGKSRREPRASLKGDGRETEQNRSSQLQEDLQKRTMSPPPCNQKADSPIHLRSPRSA